MGLSHQEKSTRLAWSGTSGTSGMSGGFSCQKSLSSHFFSEFLYSHNYIRIFILSQLIHKFIPSRIFTSNFVQVRSNSDTRDLVD
jgi:hypothetical protein